jgi:predicted NBD/HSP70 family sugar kinase
LVAELIVNGVNEVALDRGGLLGVGIGVPGAVADERVYAPTLGWSAVPLGDMVRRHIEAPLQFDNVARTLGQAEVWRGAGKGARRAVVALLGVGLGAALVTESASLSGVTSTTSEWGHTVVNIGGRQCRCGSLGCLEAYVGAEAILADYNGKKPFEADGLEGRLAELVARKEKPAARTLDKAAQVLGIGIANLANLLDPDIVVLSGWAGLTLGPRILPTVREVASQHALPYISPQIVLGELGSEAVALGAATLPIMRSLADGGPRRMP